MGRNLRGGVRSHSEGTRSLSPLTQGQYPVFRRERFMTIITDLILLTTDSCILAPSYPRVPIPNTHTLPLTLVGY
jgi:hypothetical protein